MENWGPRFLKQTKAPRPSTLNLQPGSDPSPRRKKRHAQFGFCEVTVAPSSEESSRIFTWRTPLPSRTHPSAGSGHVQAWPITNCITSPEGQKWVPDPRQAWERHGNLPDRQRAIHQAAESASPKRTREQGIQAAALWPQVQPRPRPHPRLDLKVVTQADRSHFSSSSLR